MSMPSSEREQGQPSSGSSFWIVGTLVVVLALGVMWLGESVAPPLSRGDLAPDFDLPRLDGAGRISRDQLEGRVALVNFWATWCKPCEEEMPAMDRLYRALREEGFELVAISVDETREDVDRFQERMQVSFPILLDPSQDSSRSYQTMGYPESLLIDPEGRIVERYVGPRAWDHPDYVERIRRLMGGAGSS
jgi:peroxiredoxin